MAERSIPLQPEKIFHIYNHAVGTENLFNRDEDYIYFLKKLDEHLSPICSIVSYCLLPSHYHLLIKFSTLQDLKIFFSDKIKSAYSIEELTKQNDDFISKQISQILSNFFNTYSKHYNFINGRVGTLFKRTFRRKEVMDNDYLQQVICYIHQNPLSAGFTNKLYEWKYSSYNAIVSDKPTLVDRAFAIDAFDDIENFKFCHLREVLLDDKYC